ncbi:MAG TPA: LytR family transcriptional regulator, partial [Syntrophomonas sp.]|nr:LytR family transcriptional regulator [Syntrophomonas sp.]
YVSVDMDAVVQIVDALGGVEYNVPKNIYHKTGRLLLNKGQQVLNGRQFLIVCRNRNYRLGDLQRVKNQQDILLELFKQFKS